MRLYNRICHAVAALFVVLFISSCASASVRLTDKSFFTLPGTEVLPESFDSYQLIEGTIPGMTDRSFMEAFVSFDGSVLEAVIIAPSGQSIADIKYDGRRAVMESTFIPGGNKTASYITADLLLVYGRADILGNALSDCGLQLTEKEIGGVIVRSIADSETTIYRIEKTQTYASVENYCRNYNYRIEQL